MCFQLCTGSTSPLCFTQIKWGCRTKLNLVICEVLLWVCRTSHCIWSKGSLTRIAGWGMCLNSIEYDFGTCVVQFCILVWTSLYLLLRISTLSPKPLDKTIARPKFIQKPRVIVPEFTHACSYFATHGWGSKFQVSSLKKREHSPEIDFGYVYIPWLTMLSSMESRRSMHQQVATSKI